MAQKILVVHNTKSGFANALADYFTKLFSPKKHPCYLVVLTRNAFGVKSEWSDYIKSLDTKVVFYHYDEFSQKFASTIAKKFPDDIVYPTIFAQDNEKLEVLIPASEIMECATIGDLKDIVTEKLLMVKNSADLAK